MYLTNSMFEDTEIRTKKTHINWHFVRKLKYTHFNFLKNLHIYVYSDQRRQNIAYKCG